jgi:hypothetical protein
MMVGCFQKSQERGASEVLPTSGRSPFLLVIELQRELNEPRVVAGRGDAPEVARTIFGLDASRSQLLGALSVAVRNNRAETQLILSRGDERADHGVLLIDVPQRRAIYLAQPE